MGSITRSFANNIGTSGILKAGAFNNASLNNVTALNASIALGNMVLISSQTASDSATVSFTTGIDSTYKEYQFWFVDIHARTDLADFTFNFSTDSGSNYNVTKTTTFFTAYHNEADTQTGLQYESFNDIAQGTGFALLGNVLDNNADDSAGGYFTLFNPSNTTYVKHFISVLQKGTGGDGYCAINYVAGYGNTTSAVNAIQFKMSSGNMDGTILMYGIK